MAWNPMASREVAPKSRKSGARQRHSRKGNLKVQALLWPVFGQLPPSTPLWPGGPAQFSNTAIVSHALGDYRYLFAGARRLGATYVDACVEDATPDSSCGLVVQAVDDGMFSIRS